MFNKSKMLFIALGSACLATLCFTSINAAAGVFANTNQFSETAYFLAYAEKNNKTEMSKESSQESHVGMKSDEKEHKGHGMHCNMSRLDLNNDGKISKEEFVKHHEAMFEKKDLNKDGYIDKEEMQKMHGQDHGSDRSHAQDDEMKK